MSTRLEIPEWTGSALTAGAFSQYAERVVGVFTAYGMEDLALTEIGPALIVAQSRFAEFVNRERSYDETPEIAKADANRDALWNAFYHAWHFTMQLDPSHALYKEAEKLRSEMTAYKGVYKHELAKETTELRGLQRELNTERNVAALAALGLTTIADALFAANDAARAAMESRSDERSSRAEEKAAGTTPELRKAVAALLVAETRRVNAVNEIAPSEAASVAIGKVAALVEEYKLVASQFKGKKKEEPAPEPEPAL